MDRRSALPGGRTGDDAADFTRAFDVQTQLFQAVGRTIVVRVDDLALVGTPDDDKIFTRGRQVVVTSLGGDDVVKQVRRDEPKIGRNDPCHCGSGKKYKKCHGAAA